MPEYIIGLYHTKNYQGTTTELSSCNGHDRLYHTKNYQGTTTAWIRSRFSCILYHTKNYQGTTTAFVGDDGQEVLYHTKNYQGTTTSYPTTACRWKLYHTKNYQGTTTGKNMGDGEGLDYTIPRTTRELQPAVRGRHRRNYYTIPRTTRELQPEMFYYVHFLILYHTKNYQGTTTCTVMGRTWTELYHTKNYQGTTTYGGGRNTVQTIIPYQELPGNYNDMELPVLMALIIPYQELPGNYNLHRRCRSCTAKLYHTKNYQGTTTRKMAMTNDEILYHTKNYQGTTTQSSFLH